MMTTTEKHVWRFFNEDEDTGDGHYLQIYGTREFYTFEGTFREAIDHIDNLSTKKDPCIDWSGVGIFIEPVCACLTH